SWIRRRGAPRAPDRSPPARSGAAPGVAAQQRGTAQESHLARWVGTAGAEAPDRRGGADGDPRPRGGGTAAAQPGGRVGARGRARSRGARAADGEARIGLGGTGRAVGTRKVGCELAPLNRAAACPYPENAARFFRAVGSAVSTKGARAGAACERQNRNGDRYREVVQ